jgi:hypothetical protein
VRHRVEPGSPSKIEAHVPRPLARPARGGRRRDATCLALLIAVVIGAFAAHLVFSDPAWSAATAGVFWAAMAGIVAWALKGLGVGAEALRLIKAVRGK